MKNKTEEKQASGKKKNAIIVGAVVVIAVLIAVIIFLVLKQKKPEEETKRNVVVTQDNAEKIAESMADEEYVAPGYYSTQMSTTWHFTTGDAVSSDAYVANDTRNTNDVFFDVFLAEDETTPILQSPVIPRGAELDDIALDKPLEAGTYECVMVYHLVDDEQNTVSTLRIGFTIVVGR